jgi:hypothetical protein
MDSERIKEILEICRCYESGFNHGISSMSYEFNKHPEASREYIAWNIGYSNGCDNAAPDHPELEELH